MNLSQDAPDSGASSGCPLPSCSDSSSSRVKLAVAYKAIAVADAVISGMHIMDSLEKMVTELLGALVLTGRIPESEYLPNESARSSEMQRALVDLRERFVSCYPDIEWKSDVGLARSGTTGNPSEQGHVDLAGVEPDLDN